jgi:carbonic anhydrase
MDHLIDGYLRFHGHVFPQKRRLYETLSRGQRPRALFITCSDSRVQPHEFTQTDAGDLFMERSLGNLVPRHGRGEHEALAAIEYAVVALGVAHIIVCGHSQCGAVNALLHPESLAEMPTVAAWLENAEETRQAVARKYSHLKGDELLAAAVHENVMIQVEHLRGQPCVAPRLEDGRLQVHGWVYEFERGLLTAHDPVVEAFVPAEAAYGRAPSPRRSARKATVPRNDGAR